MFNNQNRKVSALQVLRYAPVTLVAIMAISLFIAGCLKEINPDTGIATYQIDPKVAEVIENTTASLEAGGGGIAAIISALNPGAGAIASTVIGILTTLGLTYRKWKKPLIETTDFLTKVSAGARAAADVIDDVIKPNANLWAKAKPKLTKASKGGAIMPDELSVVN